MISEKKESAMDNEPTLRLLPHQLSAFNRLHNGSILCAGVGTGKSITALAYYYIRVCRGVIWGDGNLGPMMDPIDLYIITTARKRDTGEWKTECDRFDLMRKNSGVKVTVDSWNNIGKYEEVKGAFFIFDEQRVVGNGSWSKYFIKLAKANQWILLSATPGDSWADYIPVFVANGFYKNRTQFLRQHAVFSRYITKYPKIDRWINISHLEMLRRSITVTMAYEKDTFRNWENVWMPYDEELYKKVAEERWDPWKDVPIQDIAGACYLMRKVCNSHPARAAYILSLLAKHPKLIVFYNFDYELEAMREILSGRDDISVGEWNGHRHDPLPEGDKWVYLVQYNAGAEGWNCVQTNTIVFYSQSYSYKMMEQAAGRIDRLNTPFKQLFYYILKSDAGIDKAIAKALKGKKNFNEKNWLKW